MDWSEPQTLVTEQIQSIYETFPTHGLIQEIYPIWICRLSEGFLANALCIVPT